MYICISVQDKSAQCKNGHSPMLAWLSGLTPFTELSLCHNFHALWDILIMHVFGRIISPPTLDPLMISLWTSTPVHSPVKIHLLQRNSHAVNKQSCDYQYTHSRPLKFLIADLFITHMSQCMRFPTMWYVRPAKSQISLRIRAVWSEPLLVAWVFCDC